MHDNDFCTGIAAIDNAKFIGILVDMFPVEERDIIDYWFASAEAAGWIPRRVPAANRA